MTEREKALKIYETCCRALDKEDWKYARHDEDLVITAGAKGDDFPIDIILHIQEKPCVLQIMCALPFRFSEEKRVEGALAVSIANYGLINGSFDTDITDGETHFRLTQSYAEGDDISPEHFVRLLMIAVTTTDKYNDRFLAIEKGFLSLEDFAKKDRE